MISDQSPTSRMATAATSEHSHRRRGRQMPLGRDMHQNRSRNPCAKRCFHPDYYQQLGVIFCLCAFLLICRVTYHPKPFKIGSLPLDINYYSGNTSFSMPMMTMLVFQTVVVGLGRLLN